MPRRNRTTRGRKLTPHPLIKAVPGSGKRKGDYKCRCGAHFTSINDYEAHRATARREAD